MERESAMSAQVHPVDDVFSGYPDMIVHPVNCTGVCKDALSMQLKRTLPDYFRHYTRAVLRHRLSPGTPEVYVHDALFGTRWIVILPIRNHWKETLLPLVVKEALAKTLEAIRDTEPRSVALPELEGPPLGWLEDQMKKLCDGLPYSLEVQLLRLPVDGA
jgi:Macro domain